MDHNADISMLAIHQIGALGEAKDAIDLHKRLQAVVWGLGFNHFVLGFQIDPVGDSPPVHFVLSAYPEAWQTRYHKCGYFRVDPTVAHCQASTEPLIWSEDLVTTESREMWDEARKAGVRYGVSVGTHEYRSVKSIFSLARDRPIEASLADSLCKTVRVVASTAHFAAAKFAVPQMVRQELRILTKRETEILRLVSQGKSTAEVAEITETTQRTVGYHLGNMFKKLGCRDRRELIAKGIALGLTPKPGLAAPTLPASAQQRATDTASQFIRTAAQAAVRERATDA